MNSPQLEILYKRSLKGVTMKKTSQQSLAIVILVVISSFFAGCSNQVDPSIITENITQSTIESTVSVPTTTVSSSISKETKGPIVPCESDKNRINPTRNEPPFTGQSQRIEENLTLVVKEFGNAFKIPGYVPESFFYQTVSILDSDEHGRTVLIFVNKSHGSYSSTNESNEFVVVFSKNTDIRFSEFIGLSPTNVCINGAPGFYYSKPGWNMVRWMDGDIERWIEGSFDEDILIRIAESLYLPSPQDLGGGIYWPNRSMVPGAIPPEITLPATPGN